MCSFSVSSVVSVVNTDGPGQRDCRRETGTSCCSAAHPAADAVDAAGGSGPSMKPRLIRAHSKQMFAEAPTASGRSSPARRRQNEQRLREPDAARASTPPPGG